MATNTQTKPLEFQVMDTCPHCGQAMPIVVASTPPAEVVIKGKKQEVVNTSRIGGHKARGKYLRQVPVVEVVARDE